MLILAASRGHTKRTALNVHSCPRSVPVTLFCFPPIVLFFVVYEMMIENPVQLQGCEVDFSLSLKSNLIEIKKSENKSFEELCCLVHVTRDICIDDVWPHTIRAPSVQENLFGHKT